MNDFKATPECWEWQEKWASKEVPDEDSSCFLELRARIEQLEAQASNLKGFLTSSTPPPVATVTRDMAMTRPINGDPAQWAEQRCAETLAIIRPVMKLHKIRTSEWPKPPSLKEQAPEALERMDQFPTTEDKVIIRRALEALPND